MNITEKVKLYLKELLYFYTYVYECFKELLLIAHRKQVVLMVLFRQILFTGVEALKLITLMGLALGAIIIIQGMSILDTFGQSDWVHTILILVLTKELGPLLTAFIIIARSGTAISTELGNMVVNNEIEALISFGISPISYLVVPRIVGVTVALFCLSVYFNLAGLLGGYVVSAFFYPLSFTDFFSRLLSKMQITDIFFAQLKCVTFGFIISIISSYHGLKVQNAFTEVPWRTIQGVVSCLTWVLIFNILIDIIMYSI